MENLVTTNGNGNGSIISIDFMKSWYQGFADFTKTILKKDIDYGEIPGISKPTLLKPGAEKLRTAYGLTVKMTCTDKHESDTLLDFTYKCIVKSATGQVLAECDGNCNSKESKYRYRYVSAPKPMKDGRQDEEAIDMAIFSKKGKWGKTKKGAWIWLVRSENPDIWDQKNTIIKIAQKRAFVGAMLMATGASEFFTQDVEDMEIIETHDEPIEKKAVKEVPKEMPKKAEVKASTTTKQFDEKSSGYSDEENPYFKMKNAATIDEVIAIWKANKVLQNDKTFIELKEKKKVELGYVPPETKQETIEVKAEEVRIEDVDKSKEVVPPAAPLPDKEEKPVLLNFDEIKFLIDEAKTKKDLFYAQKQWAGNPNISTAQLAELKLNYNNKMKGFNNGTK